MREADGVPADRRAHAGVGARGVRAGPRRATRSCTTPRGSSPTRSCATSPPSAATSPTPTRPTTTRPRCWPWAPRSSPPAPAASDGSRSPRSSPGRSRPRSSPTRSSSRSAFPSPPPRSGGAYLKLERKVGDFATAAVAVAAHAGGGRHLRAGRASASPTSALTPIKATPGRGRAEGQAAGRRDDRARRPGSRAEAAEPSEDLRGSVEYKRDLVRVLTGAGAAPGARRAPARKDG